MKERKTEEMLSQLIGMVGNMREDLLGVKEEICVIKEDLQGVKEEQVKINQLSEIRHKEIMNKFDLLVIDQDYIWEKSARNEREIAKLKKLLEV
jgi:hypothetical protein